MARQRRLFVEGQYYEVCDRTFEERYWLLPSPEVNAIILEGLALARRVAPDVGLVVLTVMSNHWHAIVRAGAASDGISRFMQAWKSHVAVAMNKLHGRKGSFWSRRFSSIALLDEDALLSRIAYHLLNPVAAGLCRRVDEWPGVSTTEHLIGVRTPASTELIDVVEVPPGWARYGASRLSRARAELLEVIRAKEAEIATERRRAGIPVARVAAALRRTRRDERPTRPERGRKPLCFASTAIARSAYRAGWRAWNRAYVVASSAFRTGDLWAEFPARAHPPRLSRPPTEAAA